jgi:hypothetical protein
LEEDAIDLVDLDELDLHALVARAREVLADVVGSDGKLAVAPIDEAGELDPRGAAKLEERLDRGAGRPARVEDVVDEHAGATLELEVELGRLDDGLRVERCVPVSDDHVVAMERDVERAEGDLPAREVGDVPAKPMRKRDAARVDADERDAVEVAVSLDDLVRDSRHRSAEGVLVQEEASVFDFSGQPRLLSGLTGPS